MLMRKRINAGRPMAMASAIRKIMLDFGLIMPANAGSSISFPLSAVAAREIEFSSRFCKSIK